MLLSASARLSSGISRSPARDLTQRRLPVVRRGPYLRRPVPTVDDDSPDLARELEERDELLLSCRELLLTIGTPAAAALVGHINAVLDLDDGFVSR